MHIPFTFNDFKSKENFLALQNKFAIYDERENPYEAPYSKVVKKDFEIIYKDFDMLSGEDTYANLSFHNDFLFKKIDKLAKRYIESFKRKIENDHIVLDTDKLAAFSTITLKKIHQLDSLIKNADYLFIGIRHRLLRQTDIVSEYLSNVHLNPTYSFNDKIKFKWNKIDLLLLFTILRESKIIDNQYDKDFGLIMDKSFLYQDRVNKKFKSLENSGKLINDYKNGNKPVAKALERLKEFFTNPSLYKFPY